jgi:hypothetical protein
MCWIVSVIICAVAGSAGISPRAVLPMMAAVITISTVQRLRRKLLQRRSAISLQTYAVALALIAGNALAACAAGFMIASLARHLTMVSWS